ncbi:MAG TPA: bifunctional 3-demethylubiquinol 3-O-methyltransferase/2-polyprenyl-6-hydroxyphenol methylase, partial [Paracoccus sp. (in: a-proteobacteria)]|nr:bifunctional 3-demethylubiquinol 3-O-methyltransferase/2-polyprenyl-6-hydroxyphenol methylase [Paracoccus sp. (in: a-proteobacteria)]
ELAGMFEGAGARVVDRTGMVFDPLRWRWSLSKRDLSVNYAVTGVRA